MAATEVRSGKLTSVRRECENMTTNWLHTRMCWPSPLASGRLRSGCTTVNCSNPSNSVAAGCRGPWRGRAGGGMPPYLRTRCHPSFGEFLNCLNARGERYFKALWGWCSL